MKAVETCAAPGDFDGNGVVDGLDLVMLINNLSLMDIADFAGVFGH